MKKSPFTALLIGRDYPLAWALPQLLARAGFYIDAISSSRVMQKSKFIRHSYLVPPHQPLAPAILDRIKEQPYDWIIITEDGVLAEVLQSNLPSAVKLRVLPVQSENDFTHLYSKIGLSKVFSSQGVTTPAFSIAHNLTEALSQGEQVGYPLLLKLDSSGGGIGIFEINSSEEFCSLDPKIFHQPVLLQQKISGIELDLSALYLEGKLIHFNYAKVEKCCWKFGISSLRTYSPLSLVEEQIFHEVAHIGKVLGAHGFTNIGCMQFEGRRFYFEVDMRPNAWIEFPRFFGEDPALRIRKWFFSRETLTYPVPALPNQPSQLLLPYFLRLKRFELLCNRYNVWKFIPKDDLKLTLRLLRHYLFSFALKNRLISLIKSIVPRQYHKNLSKLKSRLLSWKILKAFL